MDWSQWVASALASLSWLHWLIVTLASSAIVGVAVRHFTKTAITHAFQIQLEKAKFQHSRDLQSLSDQSKADLERLKADLDASAKKELEYIKAEIALFANTAKDDAEKEKSLYMTVANVRATSYPKLVSLLRRMKRQFEGLHSATEAEHGGPINLDRRSKRSELVRKSITELAQLEKEFDDELSSVRLFTRRSDYALQSQVQGFCRTWERSGGMFSLEDKFLRNAIDNYNDDISYLSEEFYKPEINIRQSGELLGHSAIFGERAEDAAAEMEAKLDARDQKTNKITLEEWLVARKPGASLGSEDKSAV